MAQRRQTATAPQRKIPKKKDTGALWQPRGEAETGSAVRRALSDDTIVGPGKSQHVAGDFLDKIRVGRIGAHQRNVARKLGAHGLEALDFELQSAFALEQCVPCLEAVTAMEGVIGEIGRQT